MKTQEILDKLDFWKSPLTDTLYLGITKGDNALFKREITEDLFHSIAKEMGYVRGDEK